LIASVLVGDTQRVRVEARLPEPAVPGFDYLFSFEVLEHIDDDAGALRAWLTHLKPGGMVLCSVPAERRRFNATDLLAGHFRRYDRADVEDLVSTAGLRLVELHSCGAPVTWAIERMRLALCTLRLRRAGLRVEDLQLGDPARTAKSGSERGLETLLFPFYASPLGRASLQLASVVQRRFYATDLGVSYLFVARKP
jgi:SAM-dependent methyltransferase